MNLDGNLFYADVRCVTCPQRYHCNKFIQGNMRNIFPQVENQAKQNFSQSKEYQKIKENTTEESSDTISVLSDIAVNFEKMSKNFTEQNNLLKENLLSMKTELQDIKEKFNNDFFTANKSNEVEVEVITPEENKKNKKSVVEDSENEIAIYGKTNTPILKEKKTIFGKKWVEEKQ